MYLVNKSSKLEPVNRVYKIREKSQSLLDHPRTKLLAGLSRFYMAITSPSASAVVHNI